MKDESIARKPRIAIYKSRKRQDVSWSIDETLSIDFSPLRVRITTTDKCRASVRETLNLAGAAMVMLLLSSIIFRLPTINRLLRLNPSYSYFVCLLLTHTLHRQADKHINGPRHQTTLSDCSNARKKSVNKLSCFCVCVCVNAWMDPKQPRDAIAAGTVDFMIESLFAKRFHVQPQPSMETSYQRNEST